MVGVQEAAFLPGQLHVLPVLSKLTLTSEAMRRNSNHEKCPKLLQHVTDSQPLPLRGSANRVAARAQQDIFYINWLDFKTTAHSKNVSYNLLFFVFFAQSLLQPTPRIGKHGSALF